VDARDKRGHDAGERQSSFPTLVKKAPVGSGWLVPRVAWRRSRLLTRWSVLHDEFGIRLLQHLSSRLLSAILLRCGLLDESPLLGNPFLDLALFRLAPYGVGRTFYADLPAWI
jgi:hypothetical protein